MKSATHRTVGHRATFEKGHKRTSSEKSLQFDLTTIALI
jgi:hypothetical protein